MALRAHLTSFVNICWASGEFYSFVWQNQLILQGLFISACAVRGSLNIHSDLSWRLLYMLQWIWPVPLTIVCLFAPESERYIDGTRPTRTAN
jgi:SP family general alpha glucoside:H+ symporter-like MFS transporter